MDCGNETSLINFISIACVETELKCSILGYVLAFFKNICFVVILGVQCLVWASALGLRVSVRIYV